MTERICTCGHKESEHGIYGSCLHEMVTDNYDKFCDCMKFDESEYTCDRSALIEANELIAALQDKIARLQAIAEAAELMAKQMRGMKIRAACSAKYFEFDIYDEIALEAYEKAKAGEQ